MVETRMDELVWGRGPGIICFNSKVAVASWPEWKSPPSRLQADVVTQGGEKGWSTPVGRVL